MAEKAEKSENEMILDRMRRRYREASLSREPHVIQADMNDAMFMGRIMADEVPLRGHNYFLINKTQPAIITSVDIQLEERPRTSVVPRESAAPPRYFLSRKALMTVRSLIQKNLIQWKVDEPPPVAGDELGLVPEAQPVPTEAEGFVFELLDTDDAMAFEVDEAFVERVMPLMGNWPPEAPKYPPALKPKDLVAVDDITTAKVAENMLKIDWDRDDNDVWISESLLNNAKHGWNGSVCSWNKDKFLLEVRDVHYKNAYLQPNAINVQKSDYVEVREFLSVEEAKEKYPQAKAAIDKWVEAHQSGAPRDIFAFDDVPFINTQFETVMVYVYHEWSRNKRYPMTEADAVDKGAVVLKDGVYYLTDDEYEITEKTVELGGKGWPTRAGIQYVQMVAGEIVLNVECPFCDIPVPWNKNIPISYRPYGQGDPERLWYPQKMIDKLWSILVDHITYYRSPQQIYPLSVYKKMEIRNKIHSYPGRDGFLEDAVFERYREFFSSGKGFNIDPPKLTSGYVDLLMTAMKIFDDISGNMPILQGKAPGSDTSGKAIESLQTAARGMIGFKAAQTANMLKQLARLRIDSYRKFLPLFMWAKMNDKYPMEVLAAIRERFQNMEFDLEIIVASGSGELLDRKKEQLRVDAAAGLVSPQHARKVIGYEDEDKDWQNPAAAPAPAPKQPPGGAAA